MCLQIDWTSLIAQSKFPVFALLYFVFESNFSSTSPAGAYIWRGDLKGRFLRHQFGGLYLEGLIHGGAYFWNSTVFQPKSKRIRVQVLESKPVGLLTDGFMILSK